MGKKVHFSNIIGALKLVFIYIIAGTLGWHDSWNFSTDTIAPHHTIQN